MTQYLLLRSTRLLVFICTIYTTIGLNSVHALQSSDKNAVVSLAYRPDPVKDIQLTFSMIKPLAVKEGHTGDILARIEAAGFRIVALRMRSLSQEEAKRFYAEHASKSFYMDLVQKMSSGPVVTMVLQKCDAVASMRQLVGATDPTKAANETIRKDFGKSTSDNAIHASDGPASAEREIAFFFTQNEVSK